MEFSQHIVNNIINTMNALYDEAYKARDEVEWYDRGMFTWDILFATESPLIRDVARARHDCMSSDRECAAFGEAVLRLMVGVPVE